MHSKRDYPDEKTAEELNRKYGDEPLETDEPLHRRRFLAIRLAALFVVLVFLVFSMGSLLQVWPALDILSESRELSEDPVVQELRKSVVNIRVLTQGSGGALSGTRGGTGFNINPDGLIITNRHVLEDARMVFVLFPGHGIFQVTGWAEHASVDLAAVTIDGNDLPTAQLSTGSLSDAGDEVLIIGNPLGFSRVAARGQVEGYRHYSPGAEERAMVVSAPIHPGSSGSPVFNSGGKVVGVVFASIMEGDGEGGRGLCVPLDRLQDFVHALYSNASGI